MAIVTVKNPCPHCGGFKRSRYKGGGGGCATPRCLSRKNSGGHRHPQHLLHEKSRQLIRTLMFGTKYLNKPHPLNGRMGREYHRRWNQTLFPLSKYGKAVNQWQWDHIIPLVKWDLNDPGQFILANAPENIQPMWRSAHGMKDNGKETVNRLHRYELENR